MSDRTPATPAQGGIANALRGVSRLARGDASGLAFFSATPHGFLASLAPWIAFTLVGAMMQSLGGQPGAALIDVLATVGALLAPAVLSHAIARAWGREDRWLLYAVAFNWCHWAIPLAAVALACVVWLMLLGGATVLSAGMVGLLGFVAYALWLHWFLTRRALGLGVGQSVGMVLLVNLGTGLLIMGPGLVAWMLRPGT